MMNRHVNSFSEWTQINENDGSEQEIIERVEDLNRNLDAAVSSGRLQTSDFMVWFHGMMDLYDNTQMKGLIFNRMKPVWSKYFKQIYPILSMNNKELTKHDIMEIKRYKHLSNEEVTKSKNENDYLRELGLL
jgi:hypothetical protein